MRSTLFTKNFDPTLWYPAGEKRKIENRCSNSVLCSAEFSGRGHTSIENALLFSAGLSLVALGVMLFQLGRRRSVLRSIQSRRPDSMKLLRNPD
jgi:hypothetical protein